MNKPEIIMIAEKANLSIATINKENRIIGGTKVTIRPGNPGTEAIIENMFVIFKEGDIWVATLPVQRLPAICKMNEDLEIVVNALSNFFTMANDIPTENDLSIAFAIADFQLNYLAVEIQDTKHLHILDKNIDRNVENIYPNIVESYSKSEIQWSITLKFIGAGWLIYSENCDEFYEPETVNTLAEAVDLITSRNSSQGK